MTFFLLFRREFHVAVADTQRRALLPKGNRTLHASICASSVKFKVGIDWWKCDRYADRVSEYDGSKDSRAGVL